ncbi:Papain-like cysteine peptidase superfamily [Arabidopsis suecica]|uniref:Papain-like cysteine peptidase superfamily n=1 Tax=Arabidopsis suecica TaxID=45249 RepID=A0A8T2ADT9_ARASU|nr:Papain-like cysteine peptidase superfamily [Arabidopsis suecica]
MADQFTISRNIFTEEILDFFDNVPSEIASVLPELIISKPDGLEFRNRGAREEINSCSALCLKTMARSDEKRVPHAFAITMKCEIDREKIHGQNWHDEIPVEDQGRHDTCWKVTSSANISDARCIHKIDPEYTRYSGQFLMEFANKAKAQGRFKDSKGVHYCYGYSSYSAMVFAMNNGIPVEAD